MCILVQNKITAGIFFILLFGIINYQFLLAQNDLVIYLPEKKECGNWKPVGSPEKSVGEDLFLLINGGAEIYHEYGFKQAIMQTYENKSGKSINLELYEMIDPASAFGIYSFKTSSNGKDIQIGDEALLDDYYLNVWKGNFLITVTGFDSEQETIEGLVKLANCVDKKIKQSGSKPDILNLLIKKKLINNSVKYLKGNLALFNNCDFASGNISGIKEGVIGDYGTHKIFIFKYDDKYGSEKWFENARKNLKSSARIDIFDNPAYSQYSIFGRNEERIFMNWYQNYILIVTGHETTNGAEIIKELRSKIKSTG